jgi:dihydroorotate dehydrogenase electron transfer subunit
VLSSRRLGPYQVMTIVAPEIAERARPGQFVQVAVPPDRDFILRRPFSINRASRQGGWAGTLEFSFDPEHESNSWLAEVRAHHFVDVIGPLGKGFAHPRTDANCLLVAEGYAAGPLYFLAEELRSRKKHVDMILAGPTHESLFKPIEAKRLSQSIVIVTADGSLGMQGRVEDVLAEVVSTRSSDVVYAAGPRRLLRTVAEFCIGARIPSQVALEERMGCGMGQCLSCVVPVAREHGGVDHVRSCIEGPVFNSSRIYWDEYAPLSPAPPNEEASAQ